MESDFFDASYIAGKLKDAVKGDGMNGYTLGMTVGDIMTKAGLTKTWSAVANPARPDCFTTLRGLLRQVYDWR